MNNVTDIDEIATKARVNTEPERYAVKPAPSVMDSEVVNGEEREPQRVHIQGALGHEAAVANFEKRQAAREGAFEEAIEAFVNERLAEVAIGAIMDSMKPPSS